MTATNLSEALDEIKAEGRRVIVIGVGITGLETARFLNARGISVCCSERQQESFFRSKSQLAAALDALRGFGVEIHFGIDGERVVPLLENVGLAVLSPGVPLESSIVGAITRAGVPYVGELELGVELHGGRAVVVTGSNGKSTTASLIHHILSLSGQPSFLCGNVGTPVFACDEILASASASPSTLVVEASSYQLESCTVLHPEVSVFLNITDNHLERHGSIERYSAAKSRAARLQTAEDFAIFNSDDPIVCRIAQRCSAKVVYFGRRSRDEMQKLSDRWAAIESSPGGEKSIYVKWEKAVEHYDLTDVKLLGLHNRYNVAAAILVARALGVPQENIQAALPSFRPLEHRLEIVIDGGGGTVINDSKSTTVAATVAAYSTVTELYRGRPITLLIGGLSKAGSWEPLLSMIQPKESEVTPVVCFGKDAPLLASHCRTKAISHVIYPSLRAATTFAMRAPHDDDRIVLLSPGCASFDEFNDFEERGVEFKRLILELVGRPEPMQ